MADEPEKHDWIFVNGCDGSDLCGGHTGLSSLDTDGSDLTEEEARAQACDLALRLKSRPEWDHGGYLVAAYKIDRKSGFFVQHHEGEFVDRDGDAIAQSDLPEEFRDDYIERMLNAN